MSLTHVSVRNFQSLRSVDLDLGTFTVIAGPSSSGKSALIRAFRAIASNVRGTGMITRGQKQMAITVRTEGHVITLERGDRSSGYRLTADGTELSFTKLAGEVPAHITNALRLDPGSDSVNFAGQFDKPYLLDESGAAIARQLGELTNVNTIFEAVREANRIRSNAASTLKTRKADLDQVRAGTQAFAALPGNLRAFAEVEDLDERRKAYVLRIGRLEKAVRTLAVMQRALDAVVLPEVPDVEPLLVKARRYEALKARIADLKAKQAKAQQIIAEVDKYDASVCQAEQDFHDALTRAGVCPTCGQSTR